MLLGKSEPLIHIREKKINLKESLTGTVVRIQWKSNVKAMTKERIWLQDISFIIPDPLTFNEDVGDDDFVFMPQSDQEDEGAENDLEYDEDDGQLIPDGGEEEIFLPQEK